MNKLQASFAVDWVHVVLRSGLLLCSSDGNSWLSKRRVSRSAGDSISCGQGEQRRQIVGMQSEGCDAGCHFHTESWEPELGAWGLSHVSSWSRERRVKQEDNVRKRSWQWRDTGWSWVRVSESFSLFAPIDPIDLFYTVNSSSSLSHSSSVMVISHLWHKVSAACDAFSHSDVS